MKPNPLSVLDVPKEWPPIAFKPNGEQITLREAWQTMSYDGLSMLQVDVPGKGRTPVYRDFSGFSTIDIPEGTEGTMSREDLEASGFADSTLEAWARDKHGITIDLSGSDDIDKQIVRGDAYSRFNAEAEW